MKPALETTGLGKRYRQLWALRECCMHIPAGRITGLIGPNGAGKTTLLKLAMGLLAPDAGRIEVFGWSPLEQPTLVLARVAYVAQDRPLYQRFTVTDVLRMGRELNPKWDANAARERLVKRDIPLTQQIRKLSGGQQAQVSLALALGKRPELLLLDEPASNLDPLARRAFLRELVDAVAAEGITVVLSSHHIADVERGCD
jgi:ABC-2 type transport system ATP-binding protein